MKITAIKQQVKQTARYSIFVDERYSFSLSESALLKSKITSGQELDHPQIDDYKKLSADDKLYSRALRYVAMRPRSTWEMRSYLQRKDAADAFIDATIIKLSELRLLDDQSYADSFVHDRQLLRPTSRRKLILELKKKHLSDVHISHALESNQLDESTSLHEVITKKRRQTKYQDDQKLMHYLARQGFSYGDIKSAISSTSID